MIMTTTTSKPKRHGTFFKLLSQQENYNKEYANDLRKSVVEQFSGGCTESLSEMYDKYPREYQRMMTYLRGESGYTPQGYKKRPINSLRLQLLAVIYEKMDIQGLQFDSLTQKKSYCRGIAMRACGTADFNAVSEKRLREVIHRFKNDTDALRTVQSKVANDLLNGAEYQGQQLKTILTQ